jgi:serine/threonine protein kinase
MPLVIGARLGPYQIVAPLGAGGMGEVYRARDTRLNRSVAIKVLAERFADDPSRRARFEREAHVISQLNHPHICTLFDVGEHGGITYLVLELVEGETLAERLARSKDRALPDTGRGRPSGRPLPINEALPIAIQVADALAAAHRQGIVHRDLKPSNVMLTKTGAKLLDFGIARATGAMTRVSAIGAGVEAGPTDPPTLGTVTVEGTLFGTVQYMAPEQLEGREADARSDIFAFGAVLYEMLTGRRAFDGESQSKVIAAILDQEPPPIDRLEPLAPPALTRIVQKALAKDSDRRWQSASDLADELRWVDDRGPEAAVQASDRPRWWRRTIPVALAVFLTGAVTSAVWWSLRSEDAPRTVSRFTIPLGDGQRFSPPAFKLVGISPDGRQMVYPANSRLYLRSMSDLDAKPIPGTDEPANANNPVFSPDGRSVVFYADRSRTLKKIAVDGGTAVTLCAAAHPNGIAWSAAGILFGQSWLGSNDRGILRISPDGGKPDVVIAVKNDEHATNPQVLPDNETVLFTLLKGEAFDRWDKAQIVAQSLKSGQRTKLIEGASDGRYLPSGHIVYSRGGVLYGIPFDVRQLRTTGGPVPILDGVHRSGATGTASWSLADNGTLVYVRGPAPSTDQWGLAVSDRQGVVEPLKVPPSAYLAPRISPDGKSVAVTVDDEKDANIWLYDREGTAPGRRLTYEGRNRFAEWSPDGRRLAFQSDREGDQGLFWQLVDGTGKPERLTKAEPGTVHIPESWSPDGEHLLFAVMTGSKRSVMMVSLANKKIASFLDEGSFSVFSPDGRWVAYTHNEGTSSPLIVQPFPATGAKYQVWANGSHARWSRDGKELFANTGPPYRFEAVTVTTQPTIAFSRPVPAPFGRGNQVGTGPLIRNFDIMPDDQHFLMLVQPGGWDVVPQIQVVLNWTDELKRRVAER